MNKAASVFLIPIGFMFFSCATQESPTGGVRDTIPPKLVKAVPDTFSTNFNSNAITITFNEYIQLKNLNEQLIVSPPLLSSPDVKVKSKTLLIQINDTLKPNTTYTFNFGAAISDANESNEYENFQYVLSTGAVIDSETVAGKVVAAKTLEPEKNVLVMLYDSQNDSLPYLDKPSYFGKSKEDGTFIIRNIAHGSYKLFALRETNNNYLFDSRDENISFSDVPVSSSTDSLNLKLFAEALSQHILRSYPESPGKMVFIFQKPVEELKYYLLTADPEIFAAEYSVLRDTVVLWYKNTSADSLSLKVTSPTLVSGDTVTKQLPSLKKMQEKKSEKAQAEFKLNIATNLSQSFELNDTLRMTFSHPLENADMSKVLLYEDSATRVNYAFRFADSLKRKLLIISPWKESQSYKLEIPSGTFIDVFGLKSDTILIDFRTRQIKDYGSLKINLKVSDIESPLLLQLMDEKENVFRQSVVRGDTTVNYEYVIPMIYRLKIIVDTNKNGKWDTGNYLQHLQPEKVFYNPTLVNVRANWDMETDWNISEMLK